MLNAILEFHSDTALKTDKDFVKENYLQIK